MRPSRYSAGSEEEVHYQPQQQHLLEDNDDETLSFRPADFTQTQVSLYSNRAIDTHARGRRDIHIDSLSHSEERLNDCESLSSQDEESSSVADVSETQRSTEQQGGDPFAVLAAALFDPNHNEAATASPVKNKGRHLDRSAEPPDNEEEHESAHEFTRPSASSSIKSSDDPDELPAAPSLDSPADAKEIQPEEEQEPWVEYPKEVLRPCAVSHETVKQQSSLKSKPMTDDANGDHVHALWKENRRMTKQKVGDTSSLRLKEPSKRIGIVRAKHSIVGSIPQHWGSRSNSAVSFSFTRKLKSQAVQQLSRSVASASRNIVVNRPPLPVSDGNEREAKARVASSCANMSFVPSFLTAHNAANPPLAVDEDVAQLEDGGDDASLSFNSSIFRSPPPPFASPPPNKKRKIGVFAGRLQRIRSEILGDIIRFQSGQYPFREKKSVFDMNDPRSRAKSYMNVAIVGDTAAFGGEQSNNKHLAVLGRVYGHFALVRGTDVTATPDDCLVWLIVSSETVRILDLQRQFSVCAYNAVAIAVPGPIPWVVTCTELCEIRPSDLPG